MFGSGCAKSPLLRGRYRTRTLRSLSSATKNGTFFRFHSTGGIFNRLSMISGKSLLVPLFVGRLCGMSSLIFSNFKLFLNFLNLENLGMVLDNSRIFLVPITSVPYQTVNICFANFQQNPMFGFITVKASFKKK